MISLFARFACLVALALAPLPGAHGAAFRPTSHPRPGAVGYDVGDASCGSALPSGGAFGVVGATAGKPFHPSPCLAAEYAWARSLTYSPQYYVNLADPGHKSSHWGKGGPKVCHRKPKYDVGCAYDYGVETAQTALGYVRATGSSGKGRWWLDVEPDNSWGVSRAGIAANIADIQGALHFLRKHPHISAGIYTETVWWVEIADDIRMSHTTVWGGGANSKHHARENCKKHSITGGPALLAQWIVGTTDHDIACSS
ncbi:MAG TPA: hypothetical protein VME70_03510 [Mycobacteriales bacterium]|nr:hypothetical protein [Mycobacteriales bacterium]